MFEPYSIPFWTALAAFAGVGQVVVLLVTACFVYRYLQETAELRRTAQRQVEAAGDQLEAQIRPVIVARSHTKHQSLMLQNVGKGAAFNLRLTKVDPGFPVIWVTESNFPTVLTGSYLETGVLPEDEVHGAVSAPSFLAHSGLQVIYESVSGREYATIVDFDASSKPIRTRFFVKPT